MDALGEAWFASAQKKAVGEQYHCQWALDSHNVFAKGPETSMGHRLFTESRLLGHQSATNALKRNNLKKIAAKIEGDIYLLQQKFPYLFQRIKLSTS